MNDRIFFMNKLKLLSLSLYVLLTACASTHTPTWQKTGVDNFGRDNVLSQCKYEIGMNASLSPEKEQSLLTECMRKEGFRLQ